MASSITNVAGTSLRSPFFASVIAAMEKLAPLRLADTSFDNVGILLDTIFQPSHSTGSRVMLTIDLTEAVLAEAVAKKVSVVIAYHPLWFVNKKRLALGKWNDRVLLGCIQSGISLYSPHTALDACHNGINDWIAEALLEGGGGEVSPIQPAEEKQDSHQVGQGRVVKLAVPITIDALRHRLQSLFKISHMRIAYAPRHAVDALAGLIQTIAICAGSGASLFQSVVADLYLTGEMSHSAVNDAIYGNNASVVLVEHTNSERGYLQAKLQPYLERELGDAAEILVSEKDREPLEPI